MKFLYPYTKFESEEAMKVLSISRFSTRIPKEELLEEQKEGYEKEKLATNIWKEKAEQAKYQVNRAEADEAIAKIKKRTSALFAKPKKEMTVGEKLRDRERKRREYLQIVDELKKGMSPKQQEILEAEAYREIEKIK